MRGNIAEWLTMTEVQVGRWMIMIVAATLAYMAGRFIRFREDAKEMTAPVVMQPIETILIDAPRNKTLLAWAADGQALPWGNLCLIVVPETATAIDDVDLIEWLDERGVFEGCYRFTHWATVEPSTI